MHELAVQAAQAMELPRAAPSLASPSLRSHDGRRGTTAHCAAMRWLLSTSVAPIALAARAAAQLLVCLICLPMLRISQRVSPFLVYLGRAVWRRQAPNRGRAWEVASTSVTRS